jgi:hypothetical protein
MPIASWLRSLFPSLTITPNPSSAPQDGAVLEVSRLENAEVRANLEPDPEAIDHGVRMHIAAHDPAFPDKREAAVNTILAAIDTVARAHGFTTKAKSWAKEGPLGTVSLHLQRSRYGFECYIHLGFQPNSDEGRGPWAQDDFVRLGRFYPTNILATEEPDALMYLDVVSNAETLNEPMEILANHALPWLMAQLENPEAHALPFLSGPRAAP